VSRPVICGAPTGTRRGTIACRFDAGHAGPHSWVPEPEPAVSREPWRPGWVVAPGLMLAEWMDDNGLPPAVLAVACAGRDRRDEALAAINDVLVRRPLTAAHAMLLERGTHIAARMWLALEHDYRTGLGEGLPEIPGPPP
jgi:hypothetical protein